MASVIFEEPSLHLSGNQTRPAVKVGRWKLSLRYIREHNPCRQPYNFFYRKYRKRKTQDGRTYNLRTYNFLTVSSNLMCEMCLKNNTFYV